MEAFLRDENEMERVLLQADFFHWRLGALVIIPFLMALAVTRMYLTSPSMMTLTR